MDNVVQGWTALISKLQGMAQATHAHGIFYPPSRLRRNMGGKLLKLFYFYESPRL